MTVTEHTDSESGGIFSRDHRQRCILLLQGRLCSSGPYQKVQFNDQNLSILLESLIPSTYDGPARLYIEVEIEDAGAES